jgi:hypothetical protein
LAVGHLLDGAWSGNCGGDGRVVQQPRLCDVGGPLAEVAAERLVGLELGAFGFDLLAHLRRGRERTPGGLEIVEQLLATLEETGAGALYLCNVALECADRTDSVDEWVSYAVEESPDALPHVSFTALPPSLISDAEEATRCVAAAIDQAHADPPAAPRAIADTLSHLLVVCVCSLTSSQTVQRSNYPSATTT